MSPPSAFMTLQSPCNAHFITTCKLLGLLLVRFMWMGRVRGSMRELLVYWCGWAEYFISKCIKTKGEKTRCKQMLLGEILV